MSTSMILNELEALNFRDFGLWRAFQE